MISEARTRAGISGCGGAVGVVSAYGGGVVLQAASAAHATATSGQAKRRIPIGYLPSLRSAASGAKTPSLRTDPHTNRLVNAPAIPLAGVPEPDPARSIQGGIGARIGPGQGGYEAARRLGPAPRQSPPAILGALPSASISLEPDALQPFAWPHFRTEHRFPLFPKSAASAGADPLARVDLDVETPRGRGVEIGIGAKAAGMDAVDGTEVVDLVDVAGHAEGAHDLARRVADQLATAFEEQRPVGERGQRLHEGRLLLGLLQDLSRRSIERERPERLAMGDLETHERGAVLLLERLHPAAGVEHDRGQGVGLALP